MNEGDARQRFVRTQSKSPPQNLPLSSSRHAARPCRCPGPVERESLKSARVDLPEQLEPALACLAYTDAAARSPAIAYAALVRRRIRPASAPAGCGLARHSIPKVPLRLPTRRLRLRILAVERAVLSCIGGRDSGMRPCPRGGDWSRAGGRTCAGDLLWAARQSIAEDVRAARLAGFAQPSACGASILLRQAFVSPAVS
ncbi:hypothetical protein B0H15DRAFT_956643 [Mycena belliarum]|uniref:Uncharacterized protein n=1 Tax=Mycena belliarum TaxID=1033014 RepID=A0AAD6TP08_9AGAR|nr:hypothetical protein B0H15DRAFT_956643 [Mycena belliae]